MHHRIHGAAPEAELQVEIKHCQNSENLSLVLMLQRSNRTQARGTVLIDWPDLARQPKRAQDQRHRPGTFALWIFYQTASGMTVFGRLRLLGISRDFVRIFSRRRGRALGLNVSQPLAIFGIALVEHFG